MVFDSVRGRIVGWDQSFSTGLPWEFDGTTWVRASLTGLPRPLGGVGLAFDRRRGVVVVTGAYSRDVWEYDGARWIPGTPAPAAFEPRTGAAIAFDSRRGRTVVFGGQGTSSRRDDTWEYDGVSWWAGPAPAPYLVPRESHAMAFDELRGVTVMYGGRNGGVLDQTWEYDGAAWIATSGSSPVRGRYAHAMAYDPVRQTIVLTGGERGLPSGGGGSETWEYTAGTWTQRSVGAFPARIYHGMTFDTVRGRMVLFGGWGLEDTWELIGNAWTRVPGVVRPEARYGAGMVYDSARRVMVLLGGTAGGAAFWDAWEFDGTVWREVAGLPVSSRRTRQAMAFDSRRNRVVSFGGDDNQSGPDDELWEFDGASWLQVWTPAPKPGPTNDAAMAFDSVRGVAVLVGSETWEYDGARWTQGPTNPRPRGYAAMVFDESLGRAVVFGGSDRTGGGLLNDTWEYDGAWWPGAPSSAIPPRVGAAMARDSIRQLTLLYGGIGAGYVPFGDVWVLEAGSWRQMAQPPMALTPRGTAPMAFDEARGRHVLFAGQPFRLNETWECGALSCPFMPLSPSSLPGGDVGTAYNETITASGGTAPYTFAVTAGALPAGLGLSPGGVLSGTPTAGGAFSFTVTATDASACTGWRPYSIAVNPAGCGAVVVSPASLPAGDEGLAYAQTLSATGGTAPYTWAVTAGALPPGLALGTGSGVISGTPTAMGSYSFTVTATDSSPSACTGSRAYTIDVAVAVDHVLGEGLGPTNGNGVRVYKRNGTPTGTSFNAYGSGQWGTNVATGELNGATYGEILTAPGPGDVYGPHVRGWLRDGTSVAKVSFYAYSTLKYGANVGAGRLDADGFDEILTGPGPGEVFGPHVRAFDFDNATLAAIAKVNFFAYGTLKYGVNVEEGSVDADAFAEILTGAGPGSVFAATVKGFNYDGASLSAIAKINFNAFPTSFGVNVAGGDADGDGYAEIAAAQGPAPVNANAFAGFDYDGVAVAPAPGFTVTPAPASLYGGRLGTGDVTGDGRAELQCGAGRDPAAGSAVNVYGYTGTALVAVPPAFTPFTAAGYAYGVNVAGGDLGYF